MYVGQGVFRGEEITRVPPHEIARRGLGRCFQISKFFPELTVYENIQIPCINQDGKVFSMFKEARGAYRDRVEALLESVGLKEKLRETAGYLSYGDQRRLEIAITLACDPILLMLDEPTSGVARKEGYGLMDLAVKLAKERGMTVMFIEHDMDIIFNYSQNISVLDHGTLLATGTPQEIRENEAVQRSYLGGAV